MIGRSGEISQVLEVLARRTQNNPVLLGDPGVGKTAIVEGIAARVARGDVPEALRGRRIVALDLARMVAGPIFSSASRKTKILSPNCLPRNTTASASYMTLGILEPRPEHCYEHVTHQNQLPGGFAQIGFGKFRMLAEG